MVLCAGHLDDGKQLAATTAARSVAAGIPDLRVKRQVTVRALNHIAIVNAWKNVTTIRADHLNLGMFFRIGVLGKDKGGE
jgi:hypothetical protein